MATLEINGRRIQVDDSFRNLSPEQQQATVEEIARSMGGNPQSAPQTVPAALPAEFSDLPVPGYGSQPTQVTAQPASAPDWLGQGLSGVNEGIGNALMLPNIAEMGLRSIGPAIGNALGGDFAYPESSFLPNVGSRYLDMANTMGAIRPETEDTGDQISRRIGQELGASLPFIMVGGGGAANPARTIASELGIAAGSGLGAGVAQQIAPDNPLAEMAGQLVGGFGAAGLQDLGRKIITPFPSNPTRENMAQILADEGVDLTAGQRTGSGNLRYAESELGGNAAQDFMERQSEQFTQAALKKAGINSNRATPEVMKEAYEAAGRAFDDMAAITTVKLDEGLARDLLTVSDNYINTVGAGNQAPAVANFINEINDHLTKGGALTGEQYKSIRSRLGKMANGTSNTDLAMSLRGLQDALDNGAERFLAQTDPSMVGEWQNIRTQYRNTLTLMDAVKGAGENAAQGLISPAQLAGSIRNQNSRNWVTGKGDMTDLARAGVANMSPLPNSGTASRLAVRGMTSGLPTMAGAAIGGRGGDVAQALIGGAIGSQMPGMAGNAMLSGLGRQYLGNQAFLPSVDPRMFLGPLAGGAANNEIARLLAAAQQE